MTWKVNSRERYRLFLSSIILKAGKTFECVPPAKVGIFLRKEQVSFWYHELRKFNMIHAVSETKTNYWTNQFKSHIMTQIDCRRCSDFNLLLQAQDIRASWWKKMWKGGHIRKGSTRAPTECKIKPYFIHWHYCFRLALRYDCAPEV